MANEESYERFQINRIYETTSFVAKRLRVLADDIDRAVEKAKKNEDDSSLSRSTYIDLPHELAQLLAWGIANAHVDSPARQLRELLIGRAAQSRVDAQPIAERLEAFVTAHEARIPLAGGEIAHYIHMEGPDGDRHEVDHIIDTDLLREIVALLRKGN